MQNRLIMSHQSTSLNKFITSKYELFRQLKATLDSLGQRDEIDVAYQLVADMLRAGDQLKQWKAEDPSLEEIFEIAASLEIPTVTREWRTVAWDELKKLIASLIESPTA